MNHKLKEHLRTLPGRQKRGLTADTAGRQLSQKRLAVLVAGSLLSAGVAVAQGNSPTQLRRFIDQQVGGIQKLMVPARDADLPQPRLANGSPDPRFQTTEAKRYLGKMLFLRSDPNRQNSAGVRWRPRHQADRLLR